MATRNKNNDPVALRQRAKELLEQADQLEREAFERVGRITMKHYDSDFQGFDLDHFRKEIEGVME